MKNEYLKQATDFLTKSETTIKIEFGGCVPNLNWDEKESRNFYNVTLKNTKGSYNFVFWDSIYNTEISKMTEKDYAEKKYNTYYSCLNNTNRVLAKREFIKKKVEAKPNAYDVLSCLCKTDPSYFEQFCQEYGYYDDSRKAEKIYLAVIKEFKSLQKIFTAEQIEELQEIQ